MPLCYPPLIITLLSISFLLYSHVLLLPLYEAVRCCLEMRNASTTTTVNHLTLSHRGHASSPEEQPMSSQTRYLPSHPLRCGYVPELRDGEHEPRGRERRSRRSRMFPTTTGLRSVPPWSLGHRSWSILSESQQCYVVDVSYRLVMWSTWSIMISFLIPIFLVLQVTVLIINPTIIYINYAFVLYYLYSIWCVSVRSGDPWQNRNFLADKVISFIVGLASGS